MMQKKKKNLCGICNITKILFHSFINNILYFNQNNIKKQRTHVILLLVISDDSFFSKYQSYRHKGLVPLFDTGLNGIKVADP